ncbi:SH2 domain-containing protein 4B [Polypterus senegalus]|uniref:SH2 domain-containing protein 4B n=1 Tax=Polypterus senegalus TaxID=55291 RepID=UPI001962F7D4|nr:SH2 domain-containing protein 4B [Polypterus senegalus]
MADPVAGVTAGVLGGILLLVLLGIGIYYLWRRMCPRRHYEEFIPPTTNPSTSCQFVKPCFMTPMTPCVMPVSLHLQAIQDELTPHKQMMRGASFGDMSAFPLGSLNPGLYKCQQDEQDGDVPFPVDKTSRLCFMLEYRLSSEQLLVSLVKATNLPPVCESYPVLLKLCLLPGDRRHLQSKSKRRSCNPVFNENYVFQVSVAGGVGFGVDKREKEAEIERKFRDAMAKEKARFAAEKWREETKIQEELRKREEEERQHGEEEIRLTEEKRAKELYISLKQQHDDRQNDREDKEWQEQLRKSKAADKARKEKARCARNESNRQSLRAIEKGRVAGLSGLFQKTSINDTGSTRQNSASIANTTSSPVAVTDPAQLIKSEQNHRHVMTTGHPASDSQWTRSPQPKSRDSVMSWFREQQLPKRAGFERNSQDIAPWFHGLITRQEAESLLMNASEGSFLVRVSERIWGYTLSYRHQSGFKHFLIDASGDYYSFLGVDQIRHATLADLIEFHKEEVITTSGSELLQEACAVKTTANDCGGLFQ